MTVALLAACAGWWLAGLGWTVHATAYPAFVDVPASRWAAHHAGHSRRITLAVGPAWAVQGGATVWWLITSFGLLSAVHALGALAGVLLTVGLAVPAHQRLARGFSPSVHRDLMRANLVRSTAFTVTAVLATLGAA